MSDASVIFGSGATPLWVTGTTYAQGRLVISPTDWQAYARKVAGAGSTDPASDSTNWSPCGGRPKKPPQRGVISITSGFSASVTISAVNTAKTELRVLGQSSPSASADMGLLGRIALTNSTTITATQTTSGIGASISWELTEWY